MNINVNQAITGSNQSVNSNVSSGTVNIASAQAGRAAVEILRAFVRGDVFSADITDIKGNSVTILLDGGQSFTANFLDNAGYNIGDRASFMVQDNQGESIVLKSLPFSETAFETTMINNSLNTAGIYPSERNRGMVLELMRNNMSISKDALLDMVKDLTLNPDASVKDAVSLKRMGIEVTPENLRAYENYKNYNGAMQSDIAALTDGLKSMLTDGKSLEALLRGLTGDGNEILQGKQPSEDGKIAEDTKNTPEGTVNTVPDKPDSAGVQNLRTAGAEEGAKTAGQTPIHNPNADAEPMTSVQASLAKEVLGGLSKMLENYNAAVKNQGGGLFLPSALRDAASLQKFLFELSQAAERFEKEPLLKKGIKALLQKDGVQKLFSDLVRETFSMKASELKSGQTIKEHIAKNINKLNELSEFAAKTGNSSVSDTASNMRGNMEFLNNMNQFVAAAQIPLKHIGENGEGELYVYRRKNEKDGGDDSLRAFLHLDMQYLGPLDVYVTLNGKNVSTNFKVADEAVLDFLERNMNLLTQKLMEEGYSVSTTVKNMESEGGFDFAEEVLLPKLPVSDVKRFRFDVKA